MTFSTFQQFVQGCCDRLIPPLGLLSLGLSVTSLAWIAPTDAEASAFDIVQLRDASNRKEAKHIRKAWSQDNKDRAYEPDEKTKRYLRELHFPDNTVISLEHPSEKRLLRLRELIEGEDFSIRTVEGHFSLMFPQPSEISHAVIGSFSVRIGEFGLEARESEFPMSQRRSMKIKDPHTSINAGPPVVVGYAPNLMPILGNALESQKYVLDWWNPRIQANASSLQYPMGSPGFDGAGRLLSGFKYGGNREVFVIPNWPELPPDHLPHGLWMPLTAVGSGVGTGISPINECWTEARRSVRTFVQHFANRPNWQLTTSREGKFLYESGLRTRPNGWSFPPHFDPTSSWRWPWFSEPKDSNSTHEDFRDYMFAEIYQTNSQMVYRGKKGVWRLYYQALFDASDPLTNDYVPEKCRGQWVVDFTPIPLNESEAKESKPITASVPAGLKEALVAIVTERYRPTDLLRTYTDKGFQIALDEVPTNRPARFTYRLLHPALKGSGPTEMGPSGILFEPSCEWKKVQSHLTKYDKTMHVECLGARGRLTMSLVFEAVAADECLRSDTFLRTLARTHHLTEAKDFYRTDYEYGFPVWSVTYRGGPGEWMKPASNPIDETKMPRNLRPIVGGDLNIRDWAFASAHQKFDLVGKSDSADRSLLGIWEKGSCIELMQFIRAI